MVHGLPIVAVHRGSRPQADECPVNYEKAGGENWDTAKVYAHTCEPSHNMHSLMEGFKTLLGGDNPFGIGAQCTCRRSVLIHQNSFYAAATTCIFRGDGRGDAADRRICRGNDASLF